MKSSDHAPLALENWRDALRKIGKWHSWDPSEHTLWITSNHISIRALHGLQLMRLLVQSDLAAWKTMVLALWGTGGSATELGDSLDQLDAAPTVGLRLNVDCLIRARQFFQELIAGKDAQQLQEFEAQRIILEQASGMRDCINLTVDARVPIRFHIEYDNCSSRDLPDLLQSVLELFSAQQSAALPLLVQAQFRLDQISVKWISDEKSDHIRRYSMPSKADTWIDNEGTLYISDLDHGTCDTGAALSRLIPPKHCSAVHPEWPHRVPPEMIPVFLSAMRFSSSVTSFRLNLHTTGQADRQARRLLWQWLAFALYCAGTKHQARKLVLATDVLAEDVVAVREILAATNPLAVLFGGDPSAAPIGQLSATRFHLDGPRSPDKTTRVWMNTTPIAADVIQYPVNGLWEVLLPGYGRAWVQVHDVLQFDASSVKCRPHDITTVQFYDAEGNVDAQSELMEIIGGPVTRLLLLCDIGEGLLEPTWYKRTLAACPRLVMLSVDGIRTTSSSLPVIVDACANGSCHLSYLKVFVDQQSKPHELVDFITELCDNQHPLTKSLKKLHLRVRMRYREDVLFFNAVYDLLETNRSLAKLVIDTMDTGYVLFMDDFLADSWDEHATDPGFIHVKLPVANKLALLSVVSKRGLDSVLASLIFQFAGTQAPRRVRRVYSMLNEAFEEGHEDAQ